MTTKAETETKSTEVAKFVKQEDLIEKFRYVNSRIPILDKTSLELNVESDEQLVIAENNASEVNALIKEVDKVRKMIKQPYADAVKMIDSYCKIMTDSLDRSKIRFTTQVTNYKVVKEAQAKIERDQKLKELEVLESAKREEKDRITRIEQQLIARIFGGTYTVKDGTSKSASGCITAKDCDILLKWINENIPAPSTFIHFSILYEEMISSIREKLANHKICLIDLEAAADSPIAREGALRRINESRTEAHQEVIENTKTAEKLITKSIKSEVNQINNQVSEAGKGVRETLRYDIVDELLVPRDMLCVDNTKVTEYLNANKEKIKRDLSANEETIPGIRFYVDNKFIAR